MMRRLEFSIHYVREIILRDSISYVTLVKARYVVPISLPWTENIILNISPAQYALPSLERQIATTSMTATFTAIITIPPSMRSDALVAKQRF